MQEEHKTHSNNISKGDHNNHHEKSAHNAEHNNNNENLICAAAYIIFFLPIILIPDSKIGKFHTNQGLILLAVFFAGNIILSIIPVLGWVLLPFWNLAGIVFIILGIMNAINHKHVELPIIGKLFNVIK